MAVNVANYRILLDLPSPHPALGFSEYAQALKEIIEESDPQFAIGIFGTWGSGKTTLMNLIEDRLDPAQTIVVRFSAWRYEKEEHLIVPLLDNLRESLTIWADKQASKSPAKETALKTASILGKVAKAIMAGVSLKAGVPGMLEVSFDANKSITKAEQFDDVSEKARVPRSFYHASFRALTDAFREFQQQDQNQRIVVFIDDLDRCLPEGALQVLESMKLFFDLEGFVFVVGLDKDVVAAAVDARFRKDFPSETGAAANGGTAPSKRGADYIKKIFQLPFTLAPVAITQLDEFLESFVGDAHLPPTQAQEIRVQARPHLRYIVQETGTGVNPREIKRFINAYTLARKTKPHLDADVVLAVQTIFFQASWASVSQALYAHGDVFLRALDMWLRGDQSVLKNLGPEPIAIPELFYDYIAPGAPGNALLNLLSPGSSPLRDYINSGVATSYFVDPRVLDLLIKVTKLGPAARAVKQRAGGIDAQAFQDFRREVESLGSNIIGAVGEVSSAVINRDLEGLREISERLTVGPDVPSDSVDEWIRDTEAIVNRFSRHLRDVLNQGRP
jgi:hypothetical protein